MLVSDILRSKGSEMVSASPSLSVAGAAALLAQHRIGALLIMDGDTIAGILSERDVVRGVADHGGDCLDMKVIDLMTAKVVTCSPDQTIAHVMETMTKGRFRHVPVLDGGKLAGMISIGDVVKYRLEETQEEVRHLAAYVAGT